MSAIVNAISHAIGAIIKTVDNFVDATINLLKNIGNEFVKFLGSVLKEIFALFGIHDEDIVMVNVVDQRIITDDTSVQKLWIKLALEKMKSGSGILSLLLTNTQNARAAYSSYYDNGDKKYSRGLPETNFHGSFNSTEAVKRIIETSTGSAIIINKLTIDVPTKEQTVASFLTSLYRYTPSTKILVMDNIYYTVTNIEYVYTTNTYKVTINKNIDNKISYLNIPAAPTTLHFIVDYLDTTTHKFMYWIYQIGLGTYPELDNATKYMTKLEMLPIVELRNNFISINKDKTSVHYLETVDILKSIGMDPDVLIASIEQNPDIAKIESAYVHFAVDPKVSDPIIAKALYSLFDYAYYDFAGGNNADAKAKYKVTLTEGNYNAALMWNSMTRKIVRGSIGVKGVYNNSTATDSTLLIRYQNTDTTYIEYTINHLTSVTFVKKGAFMSAQVSTLDQGALTIPISKYFIDQLNAIEQMDLFAKSLRLSVYAIEVQHIAWYKTSAFASFIQVIAIVIAVVIFIFTWEDGGGTATAFYEAVMQLVAGFAITYVFKLLLESTDSPLLKTVYTILYIVAMVTISGGINLSNAVQTTNQICMAVTAFSEAVGSYTIDQFAKLEEKAKAFDDAATQAFKTLEDRSKELTNGLNPMDILAINQFEQQPAFLFGPDAMMYRAIGMNYDGIKLTVEEFYSKKFSYDQYYMIGIV